MSERFANEIQNIIALPICEEDIGQRFIIRVEEGKLTRDENLETHFCAYFAAYDPKKGKVFIGHHKKSNFWLFNGGHIDKGELPEESVEREIEEEWGSDIVLQKVPKPSLLTITEINHKNVKCKTHYDVWYFIPLDGNSFNPDKDKLAKEFYETGWKTIEEARELVVDTNTLLAIDKISKLTAS